jgi:hypothetical protein
MRNIDITLADLREFADAHGLSALTDEELTARLEVGPSMLSNRQEQLLYGYFTDLLVPNQAVGP